MLHIDIIAAGKLKNGPLFELCDTYHKRINWKVNLYEIESKLSKPDAINKEEQKKLASHIHDQSFVIVLDEKGNGLRSLDFANTLENLQDSGERFIQFIIGGADGLEQDIIGRANLLLSFGQQTWPHMLARAMLFEQIYRAQQILIGHPYHKE